MEKRGVGVREFTSVPPTATRASGLPSLWLGEGRAGRGRGAPGRRSTLTTPSRRVRATSADPAVLQDWRCASLARAESRFTLVASTSRSRSQLGSAVAQTLSVQQIRLSRRALCGYAFVARTCRVRQLSASDPWHPSPSRGGAADFISISRF